MTEENALTCENAPAKHHHYWYRLEMPRDEVYVKCPTVFVDRKAAGRAGARKVGTREVGTREAGRVMVLKCDGPSG